MPLESLEFVDLFSGLGGFHQALSSYGHECVFASEINEDLRRIYARNFPGSASYLHDDIRSHLNDVPRHDVLCAGFPCQPFSKSGRQMGVLDKTRGTLFHDILTIATRCEPSLIILENVGNFERHDNGNTWRTVRDSLQAIGYHVRGTLHKASGGHGLISPHHFGHPHHRDRFFAVASRDPLPEDPFPRPTASSPPKLAELMLDTADLTEQEKRETRLTAKQVRCINHWNHFLQALPADLEPPGHPLWGDEFGATYLFDQKSPWAAKPRELRASMWRHRFPPHTRKKRMMERLPSYARVEQKEFPSWKKSFIRGSRTFYREAKRTAGEAIPGDWLRKLKRFPPSLRKLEWNCKGEERDLWNHVLQFRPSGLRAKRYESSPALVAMTTTQIPLLGPQRRFVSRREGLLLQGLPVDWELPSSHQAAFAALGNGVHVDVVKRIFESLGGRGTPGEAAPLLESRTPGMRTRDGMSRVPAPSRKRAT